MGKPEERVELKDPIINREHTTFYAQDEPEKVHTLEPEVYQNRANTNQPNIRTTFYNQHSSFAQEDGDVAKAEAAAKAAKEAPLRKEAEFDAAAAAAGHGEKSEKVSIIEPMAYENRNNYALPFMRTTFYGQAEQPFYNEKHGVWMNFAQVSDPLAEDGAKKKAEDAAKEAKEAPKRHEALLDSAAAAAALANDEKTSILEPMAYERRNNYALPFMRTTFYGQQE